jgi:hypothetical protein
MRGDDLVYPALVEVASSGQIAPADRAGSCDGGEALIAGELGSRDRVEVGSIASSGSRSWAEGGMRPSTRLA